MDFNKVLTGENAKNIGLVFSLVGAIYGGVSFAVSKISAYDALGPRVAKLEARDEVITTLTESNHLAMYDHVGMKNDISTTIKRVDGMSNDMVTLRITVERLNTLLERRR